MELFPSISARPCCLSYLPRERRILPFFSFCRGSRSTYIPVAYACRELDVTLAICFCVLSALILTFKRPLKGTEPLLTPSYVL